LNTAISEQDIINKNVCKNAVRPYLYLNDWQANLLSEIFEYILSEHQDVGKQMQEMIADKNLGAAESLRPFIFRSGINC
jgi:hypothetical protein